MTVLLKFTMCGMSLLRLFVLLSISLSYCVANLFSGCEITIRSGVDNSSGIVTTPGFDENGVYPPNTQCLFKFVGKKNERVKIDFIKFMVRGVMPECINDYVDIWIEVPSEEASLIDSPLFGRYCGVDHLAGPYTTVSLTHMYVLAFFADDQYESKGLKFQYEFISAKPFRMGKPAPPDVCGWTIEKGKKGKKDKKGEIMTPNYPGMYPSGLFCFYKFKGRPGDRIRLDFEHFDLYGDDNYLMKPKYCPYDNIRIYDGFTNEAPAIGTYCWKSQPFSVYSSGNHLLVEFVSKVGHDLMNFGFKASYVISDKLIDLNFIEKSPTTHHILGSECDQRIMSSGESKGVVTSPNFPRPFPVGVRCHYFIDGLDNREELEVALLRFHSLDIPTVDSKCTNGAVSVFVSHQTVAPPSSSGTKITKISHSLDPRTGTTVDPDYKFCGGQKPADLIVGVVPRTLVVFDSHHAKKATKGFKAHYEFIKRYGVPGTMAPTSACDFRYNSGANSSTSKGAFHSPRHPYNYPSGLDCSYHFVKAQGEQVFIGFSLEFHVESNKERKTKAGRCVDDVLEIRNVFSGGAESLVGSFCGDGGAVMPGPAASDPGATELKITFRSNFEKDDDGDGAEKASGFSGTYAFLADKSRFSDCNADISNSAGGTIALGAYKGGKYCKWRIKGRRNARILLTFNAYSIEGGVAKGCDQAVLRIYKDTSPSPNSFPQQVCGKDEEAEPPVVEVVSDGSTLGVEFVALPSAAGENGFKLGWAEIRDGNNCPSSYFRCKKSNRCISQQLVCDRTAHCGMDPSSPTDKPTVDASDELANCLHAWPLPTPAAEASLQGSAASALQTTSPSIAVSLVIVVCFLIARQPH